MSGRESSPVRGIFLSSTIDPTRAPGSTEHCHVSLQIADITKDFKGAGLTLHQFEEVVRICKSQNQSPPDELFESLAVFDVDGEGFVPMSHIKHLITGDSSGEGLSASQFDFLVERIEVNQDGMVRIADLVNLIQQK